MIGVEPSEMGVAIPVSLRLRVPRRAKGAGHFHRLCRCGAAGRAVRYHGRVKWRRGIAPGPMRGQVTVVRVNAASARR